MIATAGQRISLRTLALIAAMVLAVTAAVSSVQVGRRGSGCRTNGGLKRGRACAFPFILRTDDGSIGKAYTTCTTNNAPPGSKPWCSVRTRPDREHIRGQWGECNDQCPMEGRQTTEGSKPPFFSVDQEHGSGSIVVQEYVGTSTKCREHFVINNNSTGANVNQFEHGSGSGSSGDDCSFRQQASAANLTSTDGHLSTSSSGTGSTISGSYQGKTHADGSSQNRKKAAWSTWTEKHSSTWSEWTRRRRRSEDVSPLLLALIGGLKKPEESRKPEAGNREI